MKKILSIACLALVVAAFASCKKEYITNVSQTANQTWISSKIVTADWTQTADGKADSVSLPVPVTDFFNASDATLVYFSFFSNVYEQIPEVFNGTSYSYFHYTDSKGLHLVLYAQPVNGGAPVKPTSTITAKLVLIPSVIQ